MAAAGRAPRPRLLAALLASPLLLLLLLRPRPAAAIRCLHSTCSDNYCYTQAAVSTELVDCDDRVEYFMREDDGGLCTAGVCHDGVPEGSTGTCSAPEGVCTLNTQVAVAPGYSANSEPFTACTKQTVRLGFGAESVTTYSCATTGYVDRARFRCHQSIHGTDPWLADGLRTTSAGGMEAQYWCCPTDDCTADPGSSSGGSSSGGGSGGGSSGSSGDSASGLPGFSYSQDPSWQQLLPDGTGRDCVCTTGWVDRLQAFDTCTPSDWANPLLRANETGACEPFSDLGDYTWRLKLQGVGLSPGFASGVESATRDLWQGFCVSCDGSGSAQVHFYSDGRCSAQALTSSFQLETGGCTLDGSRSLYYTATCIPTELAEPCPGTVTVEPMALSIGVHANDACRGATVGGYEWRLPAAALAAAPRVGGAGWGAGGACIPLSSLAEGQTGMINAAQGFLLNELLELRAGPFGTGAGTPLGELYPRTPAPTADATAFRICASTASQVRLAWFSDLECSTPAVLSAPTSRTATADGWETTATADAAVVGNGTTGMDYSLGCASSSTLPLRSTRAQPVAPDGTIVARWVCKPHVSLALPCGLSEPSLRRRG